MYLLTLKTRREDGAYAVQDKQDSLAMYALQITSQSQDLTNRKEEDMSKINIELNEINNMISDCLKS